MLDTETNSQVNAVYRRFREAYAVLDADGLAQTYASNGVEVYLIAETPPTFVYGRDAIRTEIQNFFDRVRERGHTLRVDFRIVNREMRGEQAYDTGYYEVSIFDGETVVRRRHGKVAIVLQRKPDGAWEYLYDANGGATQDEYDEAVPIENGEIA